MKKNIKLHSEEKELLDSFENDEWQSVNNVSEEIKKHTEYGRYAIQERIVKLSISDQELAELKKQAKGEGGTLDVIVSRVVKDYLVADQDTDQAR